MTTYGTGQIEDAFPDIEWSELSTDHRSDFTGAINDVLQDARIQIQRNKCARLGHVLKENETAGSGVNGAPPWMCVRCDVRVELGYPRLGGY